MKILVTGATGFIGAAVARKLLQQRHEVLALSRSDAAAAKLRVAGLTPVAGDFAFPASLASPASQVDAIVSTASIGAQAALLSMCGVSIVEQRQETDNGTKAGNAS